MAYFSLLRSLSMELPGYAVENWLMPKLTEHECHVIKPLDWESWSYR
jgi:hypothetical protein